MLAVGGGRTRGAVVVTVQRGDPDGGYGAFTAMLKASPHKSPGLWFGDKIQYRKRPEGTPEIRISEYLKTDTTIR
jgi:hypothetical protein